VLVEFAHKNITETWNMGHSPAWGHPAPGVVYISIWRWE